jgi:hypothetical protein
VGINNSIGIGAKGLKVTFFNLVLEVLKLILSLCLLRFPLYSIAFLLSLLLSILSWALLLFNKRDNLVLFFNTEIDNFLVFFIERVVLDALKYVKTLELLFLTSSLALFLCFAIFYKATFFAIKTL